MYGYLPRSGDCKWSRTFFEPMVLTQKAPFWTQPNASQGWLIVGPRDRPFFRTMWACLDFKRADCGKAMAETSPEGSIVYSFRISEEVSG